MIVNTTLPRHNETSISSDCGVLYAVRRREREMSVERFLLTVVEAQRSALQQGRFVPSRVARSEKKTMLSWSKGVQAYAQVL